MSNLLIRNARLVNEGREFDADVWVHNGRIEQIAGSIESRKPSWRSMPPGSFCCPA